MCFNKKLLQQPEETKPPPPPSPVRISRGTVITVGERAAAISEDNTKRQFYASFSKWDSKILTPGSKVTFAIDKHAFSGIHIVGNKKYNRNHCYPIRTIN
jgi:hypothetical protein